MTTASFLRLSVLFGSLFGAFGVGACGGSVTSADGSDASPDGGDSGGSDTLPPGDTASDVPVGRVPKEHRPSAVACTPSKGTGGTVCSTMGGGGPPGSCKTDADCTAGKNGHCAPSGGGVFMCGCFYDTCASDSECGSNVCACQGTFYQGEANSCAGSGNCKVDADCGAGGYCSPSGGAGCSGGIGGYFCHGKDDECIDTDDCKTSPTGPSACQFDATKKHWACMPLLLCA